MSEFLASSTAAAIGGYLLAIAFGGAGFCLFIALAECLCRRRSLNVRHGILLGGMLLLLALPALVGTGFYLPATLLWPAPAVEEEIVKVPAERLAQVASVPDGDLPTAEADVSIDVPALLALMLTAAWLLGGLIGFGRLFLSFRGVKRAIVRQPWDADFWSVDTAKRLAGQLGLRSFPPVYASPLAPMPMVLGFWRPVIVVPEQTPAGWTQKQWEAILLHEGAHVARRDPWAVLAQRLAVALYWWCPLAFVLSRRLSALRESICDEYALMGDCDALSYAEVLVESAERLLSLCVAPVPLALLDSAQRGLEARVTRLLAKERKPMSQLSRLGKVIGAAAIGGACLLTVTAVAFAQTQPEKKVQIKVVVDGKEIDLGDPRLVEQIQAAQQKTRVLKLDVAPAQPSARLEIQSYEAKPAHADVLIQRVETKPGDPADAKKPLYIRYALQPNDPRIEELVKQAEAIAPGSGEAIRKALRGGAKKEMGIEKAAQALAVSPDGKQLILQAVDAAKGDLLWRVVPELLDASAGGKRVIIIVENGKARQVQESELSKLLGVRSTLKAVTKLPVSSETKREGGSTTKVPASGETKKEAGSTTGTVIRSTKSADYKPAPPAATPDLDALRRQIDRISAELRALQAQLNLERDGGAQKK